jgi:hypothetical protein
VKTEKLLWKKELKLQATSRHPDDPKDAPGQCKLEAQSFHKAQLMDDATACMLSAIDSGNFITLDDHEDDKLEDGSDNDE